MWITCAEINTNRALSKEYEQHDSCPAHHYARDNAIAQSAPPPEENPTSGFDQFSDNTAFERDDETEIPVGQDTSLFAGLGKQLEDLSLQNTMPSGTEHRHEKDDPYSDEPYFDFDHTGHEGQAQRKDFSNPDDEAYWGHQNQSGSALRAFQQMNEDEMKGNMFNSRAKTQGKAVSQGRGQDYSHVPSELEPWPAISPNQPLRSPDPLYSQISETISATPPAPIRQADEPKNCHNPYDPYPSSTSGAQPGYGLTTHPMGNPGPQFYGQEGYEQEYPETSPRGQQKQRRKHQR